MTNAPSEGTYSFVGGSAGSNMVCAIAADTKKAECWGYNGYSIVDHGNDLPFAILDPEECLDQLPDYGKRLL